MTPHQHLALVQHHIRKAQVHARKLRWAKTNDGDRFVAWLDSLQSELHYALDSAFNVGDYMEMPVKKRRKL